MAYSWRHIRIMPQEMMTNGRDVHRVPVDISPEAATIYLPLLSSGGQNLMPGIG